MLPAIVALALALPQAPTDPTLAARVSQLFLSEDAADQVRALIKERGLLTVAEVGDEASYTFAMLTCDATPIADRDRLLAKLRTASAAHQVPGDALLYCEVHTKQERVKAAARRRPPANPALRDEIQSLFARDQAPRVGTNIDPQLWAKTDRELHDPLEQIFARYGVPTYAAVGPEAASHFAIMIQHQPPDFRRVVLPKLKANVDLGQGDAAVYAMMYDRAATDEGRPQRYGENFVCDEQHPDMHPAPIEDEKNVDERRAAVGKVRLALYARVIAASFVTSPCRRR